ncbi:DUF6527 family protein [Burkholderia sp. BCC1970]|uniref:DUF6527 family protein n=1 Tax=Burkholderia sp. BCC1970 TaxID=2817437 RepID=UPI0039F54F72
MSKLLSRLWNRALAYFDAWLGRYAVVVVEDLPDEVQARKLYAVGESGHYWLAALRCPCGCGETIQLPMIEGQRPRWALTQQNMRRPSLSPSVDRTIGCRSHFWLRQGMIHWCEEKR